MNPMNKKLKTLMIIGIVLAVVGIILAAVGFGLGGFKSVQLGPDGFYVSDITIDAVNPNSFAVSSGEFSKVGAETTACGFGSEGNKDIKLNTSILVSAWNAYFR